eukprot:14961523-Ditylum_brightwellii.AAC.1
MEEGMDSVHNNKNNIISAKSTSNNGDEECLSHEPATNTTSVTSPPQPTISPLILPPPTLPPFSLLPPTSPTQTQLPPTSPTQTHLSKPDPPPNTSLSLASPPQTYPQPQSQPEEKEGSGSKEEEYSNNEGNKANVHGWNYDITPILLKDGDYETNNSENFVVSQNFIANEKNKQLPITILLQMVFEEELKSWTEKNQ